MDDKLQKKANEMHALSMQSAVDTVEKLQIKLADFAKKHQSDIQDDPAFRQQFLQSIQACNRYAIIAAQL